MSSNPLNYKRLQDNFPDLSGMPLALSNRSRPERVSRGVSLHRYEALGHVRAYGETRPQRSQQKSSIGHKPEAASPLHRLLDMSMGKRRLDNRGMTMVELMVAVSLFALVLTALAGSSVYSSNTLIRSRTQLESAQFMQSEMERLLAIPYASLTSDTRTTELGEATWVVDDSLTYQKIVLVVNYAPTAGVEIRDSLVAYRAAP